MMKRILITAAVVGCAVLAACGGGNVYAASLNDKLTATDGTVFDVGNALEVEKITGAVKVTTITLDGSNTPVRQVIAYTDSNGTVWAKFLAKSDISYNYYRVGATNRYMGARPAATVSCIGGAYSQFAYDVNIAVATINDACALWQAVKANSN